MEEIVRYPQTQSIDQVVDMAKIVARQMVKTANSGIGAETAFPSIGLPSPPSVEPMAVASAAGEDVAVGDSASNVSLHQ